jgi:hypothetical protein
MEDSKMKKKLSLFMALVILFTGCSSLTLIKTESDYMNINEKLKDKNVTVSLKNGEIICATHVVVMSDSVSLMDSESNSKRLIPAPEVKNIVIHETGKSILTASLGGAFICLGAIFVIFGPEFISSGLRWTRLLFSGLAIGALSGLGKGDVYGFSESEPEPQWPVSGASRAQGVVVQEPPWASTSVSEEQVAHEGRAVVINERIGEVIDPQERDKYGLFGYIAGFLAAEFRLQDDGTYWLYIMHTDPESGAAKIIKRQTDEITVQRLKEYINQSK